MLEIALIGFVQALFFSLLIATKRKKETKDYLLILFFIFVGLELIYRYLLHRNPGPNDSRLVLFDISYWALFGPLTWMYILFSLGKKKKYRPVDLLHLIPLFIGLFSIRNFLFGANEYSSFIAYYNESTGITRIGLFCWEYISPAYLLYSLYTLIAYKRSLRNFFSDLSRMNFTWLSMLISGFVAYLFLGYLIGLLGNLLPAEMRFDSIEILPAVLAGYVFVMGFFGYKQAGIFFDFPSQKRGSTIRNKRKADDKYEKSGLKDVERNELVTRLNEVMKTKKPYLDSDLNINVLADMNGTSLHKLSQVINESFKKNFYDFVNTYRVKEAMELMNRMESEKYTIISIAYESGFRSKSSFYNAFKRNAGTTPGEFLNRAKSMVSSELID